MFRHLILCNFGAGSRVLVPPPAGFTWTPPFSVYRSGSVFDVGTFDVEDYTPTGKAYYVDAVNGNEANDGLTPGTALKRVRTALTKADIKICYIAPGVYPYYRVAGQAGGWDNYALQKSVAIRRYGAGKVILSLHEANTSWAISAGQTFTYESTRTTAITDVRDASLVDANDGGYRNLTVRASIALVEANAGSWYDDGSKIYIRTHDDRAPDSDIRPYMGSIGNGYIAGHATVDVICYLENIEFHGGQYCLRPTSIAGPRTPTVYLKNCSFKYSNAAGLLDYGGITYSDTCLAECNKSDGFSANSYNSAETFMAEINCIGRWNGYYNTQTTTNGSTAHNASRVIRVNGLYHHSKGPNIHDVQQVQSWNLGCTAYDSIAGLDPLQSALACGYNGVDITEMWFDHCKPTNTVALADLYTDDASISYLRAFAGTDFLGSGTRQAY